MGRIKKRTQFDQALVLTPSEWADVLAYQGGVCFICERPFPSKPHRDHNHKSGQIRGLLCSQCNRGLGQIEDPRWGFTPERLKRVILYLLHAPVTEALGRDVFGYPGKLTHRGKATKRLKKWMKNRESIEASSGNTGNQWDAYDRDG